MNGLLDSFTNAHSDDVDRASVLPGKCLKFLWREREREREREKERDNVVACNVMERAARKQVRHHSNVYDDTILLEHNAIKEGRDRGDTGQDAIVNDDVTMVSGVSASTHEIKAVSPVSVDSDDDNND